MTKRLLVRVKSKTNPCPDIAVIEMEGIDCSLPDFTAGSHVDFYLPNGLTRQYSLCQEEVTNPKVYRFGVKQEDKSRGGSAYIVNELQVGQELEISPPRNSFNLDLDRSGRKILIAGGIGITPILTMAYALRRDNRAFDLHYFTRGEEFTPFAEELSRDFSGGQLRFYWQEPMEQQLISMQNLAASCENGDEVYVCGPAPMIELLEKALPAGRDVSIKREYFTADGAAPRDSDDEFIIYLEKSGLELSVPPDRTILSVLSEHGIDIETSCEQGICGACICTVLEGEPDHRDFFMSDEEHEQNNQISVCCSRSKTDRLVLDI